ncbi:MAG: OmpA family protein, partial [Burkholderiales bacterium]
QKLSERRADAVRDYLVSRGVPRDRIETLGMGKTQPVPGVVCDQKATKALFDFDKAVLKPDGKAAIDSEIISKLSQVQKLELVLVTGHTDRIGTQAYNQKLSERRADAVRDYLVSKGVPRDKIETLGMGKTQPIPGVVCNQKALRELIACLAPNRRVEVEVKGEGSMMH